MNSESDKNMKGTTTVGFTCKDGVVLATETRATMGNLVANKGADKLFQIDDKIGATIAGTVSHAQSLMDVIKAQIALYKLRNEKDMSIDAVAVLTSIFTVYERNRFVASVINFCLNCLSE